MLLSSAALVTSLSIPGGKRKRDVPFTWIVQLKKVLAITWDKKVNKDMCFAGLRTILHGMVTYMSY